MEKKISKDTMKTNVSFTERTENTIKKEGVQTGAKILHKSVNTSTEQIENGYLITKSYDIKYQDAKGQSDYAYYTKKWYSKEDPLEIKIKDSALAEAFK